MLVKLISTDQDLYKLCREIVAEVANPNWSAAIVEKPDDGPEGDVCIWDFQPDDVPPPQIRSGASRNLFLVPRKDLAAFRPLTEGHEGHIVLKPVTRATLTTVLSLALSAQEERIQAAHSRPSDRDEMLQCLIETNLKLQEYDQDRTNFLARAVHDFRAPLTAISGYCGLLLSEPLGTLNENQREVLQRVQHSAKRLSRTASAMFQLSVGRRVKNRPDLQYGDLQRCLDQALHEIAPYATEKRIAITAELAAPKHKLYFDAGQMEQVLINILDNACKFTPKAGGIEIGGYPFFWERRRTVAAVPPEMERRRRANAEANAYRVDIRDSGAAIPQIYLPRIFDEYTSYIGGRDRSGAGLGLAICKMIVMQHDGDIWAQNTETGPMFSFVLPAPRPEPVMTTERQQTTGGLHADAPIRADHLGG